MFYVSATKRDGEGGDRRVNDVTDSPTRAQEIAAGLVVDGWYVEIIEGHKVALDHNVIERMEKEKAEKAK